MPGFPVSVQFFWVASPLVQFAVATAMVRRRLHREFPVFLAYSLFRGSTALLLFFLYKGQLLTWQQYGYASLVHETGCVILRFGVIYELFAVVFRRYSVLRERADSMFRWGIAGLLAIGVAIAVEHQLGPFSTVLDITVSVMDRTVDIIQCGLLLALVVYSAHLRLSWRSYAFGITVGLGIFAAADLASSSVLLEMFRVPMAARAGVADVLNRVSMGAYLVSTLVWLAYALLPERPPQVVGRLPEHDLDAWAQELQRLLQR